MVQEKEILIVIPARYESKRLPGKPLIPVEGVPLLQRVWNIAKTVQESYSMVKVVVSTEDLRIKSFCQENNIDCVITSRHCQTGTDRVCETLKLVETNANYIINLQGDNALCPSWFISDLIDSFKGQTQEAIYTPFVELSWEELDALRKNKAQTPFSGTTVVFDDNHKALWFSKNIIPTIREEVSLREETATSPVARHIGLYAYHRNILERIHELEPTKYEQYEGLEQLRWLTNNISIQMIPTSYKGYQGMSGIDSPEDIKRAQKIIRNNKRLSA